MNDPSTQTSDQRRSNREDHEAPVRMRLETDQLAGMTDNISKAGLLFFTDEPIRVTVEVADGAGTRELAGRLIRLQRMSDTATGLAVEFDPE